MYFTLTIALPWLEQILIVGLLHTLDLFASMSCFPLPVHCLSAGVTGHHLVWGKGSPHWCKQGHKMLFYVPWNLIKCSYTDKLLFLQEWIQSNKSLHSNVWETDTVRKRDRQTDGRTSRQTGRWLDWDLGVGWGRPEPSFLAPTCSSSPYSPRAGEQMGLTACPSVHQSYCTKQHTLQATTPTSVSRTEPYQNRKTPPITPTTIHTHTSVLETSSLSTAQHYHWTGKWNV